ncbi:MAG: hypothetical protein J6J38_06745 [Lachnospiraceae bacterium]|nr:hypothetical protein [Lachnospiraceae bacterium]
MCNYSDLIEEKGIERGIREGVEKGRAEGKLDILIALVRDGLLPMEEAAKRVELTVDDMQKLVTN